jgi:Fanconi anemia group J protein
MGRALTIGGKEVSFPYNEPYGSQCAVMEKAIKALTASENALLESPTGSGKTMALLCATLAWQHSESKSLRKRSARVRKPGDMLSSNHNSQQRLHNRSNKRSSSDEFKQPKGLSKHFANSTNPTPNPPLSNENSDPSPTSKLPQIFYTSRTHAQIAQVIAELNRCDYSPKSAVLASREQLCINSKVRSKASAPGGSINHECKQAIDGGKCSFAQHVNRLVGHVNSKHSHALDVEELCGQGRRSGGCPYFAGRALAQDAEIVLCPYNYLVDPHARSSMDLNLKGSVLILDEAHNIEDASRSAVSGSVSDGALENASAEFARLARSVVSIAGSARLLEQALACTKEWLARDEGEDAVGRQLEQTGLFTFSVSWAGDRMMKQLERCTLGSEDRMKELLEAKKAVEQHAAEVEAGQDRSSPRAMECMEQLTLPLSYLELHRCRDSFRLVAEEDLSGDAPKRWLCLWCMDPWVGFQSLKQARSIILTSGTLSPLDSFPSELGVDFKHRLEAQHCIDLQSQFWASTLSQGPNGETLNGSFKTADAIEYQDAVAESVTTFCEHVPSGVLVFFPSHSLMNKLLDRWRSTSALSAMRDRTQKQIVLEPRNQSALEDALKRYRGAIEEKSGAIFMSVCRGRVSEGLDFADDNGRGVVVVGVPYPNVKDLQVQLKRSHNDSMRRDKQQQSNRLSGSEWYSQQAFRALNQAVGRCIRHRADAGAILLLDQRFTGLTSHLPRWLRPRLAHSESVSTMVASLDDFLQKSTQMQQSKQNVPAPKAQPFESKSPEEQQSRSASESSTKRRQQGKKQGETGVDRMRAMWAAAQDKYKDKR